LQRVGARAEADGVLCPDGGGEGGLELAAFLAMDEAAMFEHAVDGRVELRADLRRLERQVLEGDFEWGGHKVRSGVRGASDARR
jgi:hypothetical protein